MTPLLLESLLAASAAIGACVFLLWLLSLRLEDVSIVDIFWSLGFVIAAWIFRQHGPDASPRHLLPLALVTLWGLRLALHIGWRSRGKAEDYRYRTMREKAGPIFKWRSLFTVFILQGVLILIISAPHLLLQTTPLDPAWQWTDILGLIFFAIGFFFEAVGDWQLSQFKADPSNQGKVLDTGLWRYTRHPNYFGDAMVWWGFFFFALGVPGGLWTIFAPILMNLLLLKVSGVALLEKTIGERRPKYRDYVERTNAFLPGFPKTSKTEGGR